MNKRFLVLMIAAASICGCNNSTKKTDKKAVKTEQAVKIVRVDKTVAQVLENAADNVDKAIVVTGKVKHVCQHSGRRCFLVGAEGTSLKIEAFGDLKEFNKDIMGKTIKVKGILKEQRISKEEIEKIAAEQKAEKEDGHCGTESDNILKMREWMKKNGKDYFAFYFVNGSEYVVL